MPSETTVWLSVVLVFAAVVAKIATANFLAAQRKQLADLQTALRKIQEKLQTILEQARSAKTTSSFISAGRLR
jgi:predicted component of type VI protein secretion system